MSIPVLGEQNKYTLKDRRWKHTLEFAPTPVNTRFCQWHIMVQCVTVSGLKHSIPLTELTTKFKAIPNESEPVNHALLLPHAHCWNLPWILKEPTPALLPEKLPIQRLLLNLIKGILILIKSNSSSLKNSFHFHYES